MMQLLSIAVALLANLSTAEASNDAALLCLRLRRGDGDGVTADLVDAVAVATDDIDVVDASRQDFIENQADADKVIIVYFLKKLLSTNICHLSHTLLCIELFHHRVCVCIQKPSHLSPFDTARYCRT